MEIRKRLAFKIAAASLGLTCSLWGAGNSFAAEMPAIAKQADADPAISEPVAPETVAPEIADPRALTGEPASVEQIEELLEITNADELSIQVMDGMVAQFRQLAPEVPNEWWDRFMEKVDDTDLNALIIPIYERNFTAEEVDGIIAFYQTPVGQSVISKMPAVTQESILVGQTWGTSIAEEILRELEADGYEIAPPSASTPIVPVQDSP